MNKPSKFECTIKAAMSVEADKIIATASLEKLRQFLPDIDKANDDLLPIALDACVVNQFNKNGDGIDSEMAYAIYKNFAYKPINIEHKTNKVIGTILSASFVDMDHNPLEAEAIKDLKDPFYITLGGVLWKRVSPDVVGYVEDCSNPLSPNHKEVSGSWELAFSDYKLYACSEGSRDVHSGECLAEMDELEAVRNNPGKNIYRKLIGETLPIGLGIVEYPAADVKGIATKETTAKESVSDKETNIEEKFADIDNQLKSFKDSISETIASVVKEKLNELTLLSGPIISQLEKNDVTTIKSTMKISNINQITDEALKNGTVVANSINEYISELEKANEDYKGKQAAAEALKKTAESQKELIATELETAKSTLAEVKKEMETIKSKIQAEEAKKSFDVRMAYFDENYSLSAEVKKVLAKKLSVVASDEEFETFKTDMEIFLTKKEAASTTSKASSEEILDEALKGKKAAGLPNGTETKNEKSELDNAFAMTEFIIQK